MIRQAAAVLQVKGEGEGNPAHICLCTCVMAMRPAGCASALVSSVSSVLQTVLANPPLHNAVQRSFVQDMAGNTSHWYESACMDGACVWVLTLTTSTLQSPYTFQGAVATGVPYFPFFPAQCCLLNHPST
jgi:hypothetical protein